MDGVDRRALLSGLAGALALATGLAVGGGSAGAQPRRVSPLQTLERRRGGRLGVYALDVRSGRELAWRADERFLLASTFKALLAGAVLAQADAGRVRLDQLIEVPRDGLPGNSPATQAARGRALTAAELCAATVGVSDNAAANLLLPLVGGPEGLTAFARRLGDRQTRIDRTEPELNLRAGVYDTTTPRAYAGSLREMVLGRALSGPSRERLFGWMHEANTGLRRLRGGFPRDWRAGDKTGTSGTGHTNDVAVAFKPDGGAVIVTAYYDGPRVPDRARQDALADVGRIVGARAR